MQVTASETLIEQRSAALSRKTSASAKSARREIAPN